MGEGMSTTEAPAPLPSPGPPAGDPGNTAVKSRGKLAVFVPWAIALAVLAWLLRVVPGDELYRALGHVPPAPFLAVVLAFVVCTLAADTAATWAAFRHALPEFTIGYLELLRIRGATYLLAMLNYGVGQGGLAYFLAPEQVRAREAPTASPPARPSKRAKPSPVPTA